MELTHEIIQLEKDANGNVLTAFLKIVGRLEGRTHEQICIVNLVQLSDNYINYDDLTEDDVISWCKDYKQYRVAIGQTTSELEKNSVLVTEFPWGN